MRIVFCIPGSNFSHNFLKSWTSVIKYCDDNSIKWALSNEQSCNIYYVRNMCLGADVMRGRNQKPFNGQTLYDMTVWIDSDMVFTIKDFEQLISHKEPIVSGAYLTANGHDYTCGYWDEEFFKKNKYMPFYTKRTLQQQKTVNGLVGVDYTGFGFIKINKGVFESMEYPWFDATVFDIGTAHDFCMEDVSFCLKAKKLGYKVFVDPTLIVGHEKQHIIK